MILAIDTETDGVDFYHGSRPYLVTMCRSDAPTKPWHYEWDVDPYSRTVHYRESEFEQIREFIDSADVLVLQNAKFDVTALAVSEIYTDPWPWHKTFDTLSAGHVLASNRPHDLTAMAYYYLGVDIKPFEDELEKAATECRGMCQSKRYGVQDWLISDDDLPSMPSYRNMKGGRWKTDGWLPRAMASYLNLPQEHTWWRVLNNYANADSMTTLALYDCLMQGLKKRKLYKIYEQRVKTGKIAQRMEWSGVSMIEAAVEEQITDYTQDSTEAETYCKGIAASYDYELNLPMAGANKSLRDFMLGVLKLEPVVNPKAKTDNGSLDKNALAYYQAALDDDTKEKLFVDTLLLKRSRDTAVQFLQSYKRFWKPMGGNQLGYYTIHPNLNPTGTNTLRWSCNNPNEMNISKREMVCSACLGDKCEKCNFTGIDKRTLRRCFGPDPTREWWSFDCKNIERRIPAYEAGEEEIIALFERPDDPPYFGSEHLMIGHTLHRKAFEECCWDGKILDGRRFKERYKSTLYQWVKNGNFAVQYNAQKKTADRTYKVPGAYEMIKARFKRQEALNQQCIRFADEHGYVETIPDRTVDPQRGYPLMCSREGGRISPTIPLNYHTSGTAMWIMQMCMIRVDEKLEQWQDEDKFDCRIEMQIHDELVVSMPRRSHPAKDSKRSNLWRALEIQRLMEINGQNLVIPIPSPVSIEYHDTSWAEGYTCA